MNVIERYMRVGKVEHVIATCPWTQVVKLNWKNKYLFLKGVWHEIFMNQCPQGPQVLHWGRFEFFRKFAEIFANEYLSAVSTGDTDLWNKSDVENPRIVWKRKDYIWLLKEKETYK